MKVSIQSTRRDRKGRAATGFTLVELIIVIVVIAILAAITIVTYGGITSRAVVASLTSDLDNSNKQLVTYLGTNSSYPTTLDCSASPVANSICLKASPGTTYQYSVNNTTNPQMYCLTATNGGVSYSDGSSIGAAISGQCTVINGLVAWWPLNNGANDATNSGYNALTNNATATTGQNGIAGNAYAFNGSSGGISLPSISTLGSSFSVSAWFKSTALTDQKIVATSVASILQLFTAGQLRTCNTSGCSVASANLADGNWHFAVAEGDSSSLRVYADGSSTPVITQGTYGAQIGGNYYIGQAASNYYFNGSIDDVRLYSRALSTAEIATLYSAGAQ